MFEPSDRPRVMGLPPGADFPALLVAGLRRRHEGRPPQELARVRVLVNTRRMARRMRDLFDAGPPCLLPRIETIADLGQSIHLADIEPPRPYLRRRLELAQLISALLESEPDLAPRSALFDLADSLAELMDEMQSEGVDPEALSRLDVSDQSGHWARAQRFLGIAQAYSNAAGGPPDPAARLRMVIERTIAIWADSPPDTPVILAGSTGSRGPTLLLMQAVARLPQGAVLLPGFDFDMPGAVWNSLTDAMTGEDHPQFRFARLLQKLDLPHDAVTRWDDTEAPDPGRNRVVSLALRPAPVTDQWLEEGPALRGIEAAMSGVTLLEAPSSRAEALAIAMRLRQSVDEGRVAALITPDRMLTRQVAAALDRWGILPDDSAGRPLQLSPPGRFLRHVAQLSRDRLTAEALLTLLKHPVTHSGADRGTHLLLTRELELRLRRYGPPHPDAAAIQAFAASRDEGIAPGWANWICACFIDRHAPGAEPLPTRVDAHIALAESICTGSSGGGPQALWHRDAGRAASQAMTGLQREADAGGEIDAADYCRLVDLALGREEVRVGDGVHPNVLIWGTLEARVQGAELVILAGLNEGSWPESLAPDPWLNRRMRHEAGLLLPERKIGLSAHDFQQAIGVGEVWLTRSIRTQDAETVPSRWISRLTNLLDGLPGEGQAALAGMRARGAAWLTRTRQLEAAPRLDPAPRPAPCPPVSARPRGLSVTEIKRLIRDPYAIYARHVLRLHPLDPLMAVPDALLRGTVLHGVMEDFVRQLRQDRDALSMADLMRICETKLAQHVPWAEARLLWQARLARVAEGYLKDEAERLRIALPAGFEVTGKAEIPDLGFTLTAKADRIDIDGAGNARLYDYKTGKPPTAKEQLHFDRQLLLSAAIAQMQGFGEIAPRHVAAAVYIGLGGSAGEVAAPLDEAPPEVVWLEFQTLMRAYLSDAQGYTARRAMFSKTDVGDYDQLARFGEWDASSVPDLRILE
ncbi:double-strand break repair protein AddB [Pseudooceanicola sp. 216_PA32_1]|uniref:Double-strand break repair protein AddB n=1 Tax=Pseudooceanicola pacificus TaxID=2676438 RepID=A0A844WDL4_9RHOB|nr:double-strand break repair protein AddB [Pseudooceanicola pacificus]MWB76919.1 double-strand break repair protein AddB [Pseudooceanicola pacificus]